MDKELEMKHAAAKALIKNVYEDSELEIHGGRKYQFLKMTHKNRRKVFAFFTKVQMQISMGDYSFMDTPEFDAVEKVMHLSITFEGSGLDKLTDHWERYPEDYVMLTVTALQVMSYPFLAGNRTA